MCPATSCGSAFATGRAARSIWRRLCAAPFSNRCAIPLYSGGSRSILNFTRSSGPMGPTSRPSSCTIMCALRHSWRIEPTRRASQRPLRSQGRPWIGRGDPAQRDCAWSWGAPMHRGATRVTFNQAVKKLKPILCRTRKGQQQGAEKGRHPVILRRSLARGEPSAAAATDEESPHCAQGKLCQGINAEILRSPRSLRMTGKCRDSSLRITLRAVTPRLCSGSLSRVEGSKSRTAPAYAGRE